MTSKEKLVPVGAAGFLMYITQGELVPILISPALKEKTTLTVVANKCSLIHPSNRRTSVIARKLGRH